MAEAEAYFRLNFSEACKAGITASLTSISIVAGDKTGITVTEDGICINLTPPSKFQVSSASTCYAGMTNTQGFPFVFFAGPAAMPQHLPNIPLGLPTLMSLAQISAISAALVSATAAVGSAAGSAV